jgi:hypothetical protein
MRGLTSPEATSADDENWELEQTTVVRDVGLVRRGIESARGGMIIRFEIQE